MDGLWSQPIADGVEIYRVTSFSDPYDIDSRKTTKLMKFLSRIPLFLSMVRYGNAHNLDFAREHIAFYHEMLARLRLEDKDLSDLRILDVGCGKAFWLTLLLHSAGAKVTGIDTEYINARRGVLKYIKIVQHNGMERALRTLFWDLFYARAYYAELSRLSGMTLDFNALDLQKAGIEDLKVAPNTFDLVVSYEVFEHLPDIEYASKAIWSLLKPDGRTYIYVHNYASLSGGHHIAWKYPDREPSDTVPPWDHLRENRFPEIPSWINRLRERDYRRTFEAHFEILDWIPTQTEGLDLLTPEIQAELSDFQPSELLTKGFIIIARPRP